MLWTPLMSFAAPFLQTSVIQATNVLGPVLLRKLSTLSEVSPVRA